jgi:hypothetical protein
MICLTGLVLVARPEQRRPGCFGRRRPGSGAPDQWRRHSRRANRSYLPEELAPGIGALLVVAASFSHGYLRRMA